MQSKKELLINFLKNKTTQFTVEEVTQVIGLVNQLEDKVETAKKEAKNQQEIKEKVGKKKK